MTSQVVTKLRTKLYERRTVSKNDMNVKIFILLKVEMIRVEISSRVQVLSRV